VIACWLLLWVSVFSWPRRCRPSFDFPCRFSVFWATLMKAYPFFFWFLEFVLTLLRFPFFNCEQCCVDPL
jgi:hypothetical protein